MVFNVPTAPGDVFVPAAERAWRIGLSTRSYNAALREIGIEPLKISGSSQVRESEHRLLIEHLAEKQRAQQAEAEARKPVPTTSSAPSPFADFDQRMARQAAELENLREQIAEMKKQRGLR